MHRKALGYLIERFKAPIVKPLLLRGARQVGKSYLVRMLASETGLDLVEINLEKTRLAEVLNREDFSIKRLLEEIEIVTDRQIGPNTLLFLDEIQGQPEAIEILRYLYEDAPGLRVIAAGSLLEVVLNRQKYSMPVGRVEYYYLGPMSFYEFLAALEEEQILGQLRRINMQTNTLKVVHIRAIELLKKFFFVGGMPEAVKVFRATQDMREVRRVHQSLIDTYRADVPKYSYGRGHDLVQRVFDYTPLNLRQRVVFSEISQTHSNRVKEAIDLLAMANVIHKVCHTRASGLPLSACKVPNVMKLYSLDVGIYNAMMGVEWGDLARLSPELMLTRGNVCEQFAAQHLAFRSPDRGADPLYYWLRKGSSGGAEVDFILAEAGEIFPVEIKAGATGKMRSLWQFVADKGAKRAIRLDLSLQKGLLSSIKHKVAGSKGTEQIECELLGLPLYAIENLNEIIRNWRG